MGSDGTPRTWRRTLGLVACLAPFALVACGEGDTADPDATVEAGADAQASPDAMPDASGDTTPPQLREVVAMLGEPAPGTLDLSSGNAERFLVEPAPLTFRVFADDEVSETEALVVEAVDADTGEPVPEQTAELASGLWRIETAASPGASITIRALDEAGNATVWPHAAVFPTRAEALEREWTVFRYDEEGSVVSRRASTWGEGTWCTESDDDVEPLGGTYSVDDTGLLTVERRHRMACDTDDYGAEWDSIERAETSAFYVDATYFSRRPLEREGSGSGARGTWTRSITFDDGNGPRETTERLELANDGSLRREQANGSVLEGTYELRETGGYADNFGDLLIETITQVDGQAVSSEPRVRFYTIQRGMLLIDPMVETR